MNVLTGPHLAWPRPTQRTSATVGVFDGVHLGHLALLDSMSEVGSPIAIVTFDPHPLAVIAPERAPRLLCSLSERLERLEAAGVDTVAVVTFDDDVREMSAKDFVIEVLVGGLNPATVAAGEDFRFGSNRAGDLTLLRSLGAAHDFDVLGLGLLGDGEAISSSRIRELLGEGELAGASQMLGRTFEVMGSVVPGDGRGAPIGFPTANVFVAPELLIPGRGVYAVRATVDGDTYDAVANIGVRPTFGHDTDDILEVHLLDESLDLYARPISVSFLARLRDEKRFDGVEALRSQITLDVEAARTVLATQTP